MAMSRFLVMPAVGSCIPMATLPTGAAGPIAISKPVGQGPLARNLSDDVKTIQQALNRVALKGEPGGPVPLLAVDGIKGPKTQAAIFNFQQLQVKGINADGLVEPGKQTILRLNAIAAPISRVDLNAKLAATLPLVRAALGAAVANLTAIITSGPGTPGPAALAEDRLDRHFRLSTLDPSRQSEGRVTLFETYSEMALVVNRPDLFDMFEAEDAFDVDRANPKIALTTVKGVFEPPVKNGADNPARHIRLGLGFFAPSVSADFAAFILIHELAHFTSRRDGEVIDDFGRGWFDDIFIRPLKAAKRLLNADSYASFAHECRTNSAARPAFVKTAPGGLGGAR
jgi:peptidoglycan hydrolase-like protein with peptidoglycan-binding domain